MTTTLSKSMIMSDRCVIDPGEIEWDVRPEPNPDDVLHGALRLAVGARAHLVQQQYPALGAAAARCGRCEIGGYTRRGGMESRRGTFSVRTRTFTRPYLSPPSLKESMYRENASWRCLPSRVASRGYRSVMVKMFLYPSTNSLLSQRKTQKRRSRLFPPGCALSRPTEPIWFSFALPTARLQPSERERHRRYYYR